MHSLAVYVKEGLPQKTLQILTYVFNWLYFTQCLTSFSSINDILRLHAQFSILSSNINVIPMINPSANVFVSGDFNIHHKDWLTYSGGADRLGELCYNFSISNDLTEMLNFPTWIVILTVLLFWIYLFLLMLVFVLQWLFLHWEILVMFLSLFPFTFYHIQNGIEFP